MMWPLRPDSAPEESVAPEGINGAHSANSILERIAQRLHEHSQEDAVRLFLEAQAMHLFSSNGTLLEELLECFGRDLTAQLISAFAHFRCPACKDGLEPCTECEGQGIRPESTACEICVATGRSPCGFCGGSGLATYATIPASLRYPVFVRRVHMLSRRIDPLLNSAMPSIEVELVDLLLSLNKLLIAFEDAVIASESIVDHDPHLNEAVAPLITICRHAPQRIQPRLRSILRRLAQSLASSNSQRATFYTALANTTEFAGTGLYHPMLTA